MPAGLSTGILGSIVIYGSKSTLTLDKPVYLFILCNLRINETTQYFQ
jgi:hypothetical protein